MSPKPIKKEEVLEVRIGLAEDEREPLTKDLLSELAEKEALEKEAKQTSATYRKSINERQKKIVDLRTTLEQGKPEQRNVIAHYDFPNGLVKYQDAETKKFYKEYERAVTEDDMQLKIGEKDIEESHTDTAA